MNKYIKIQFFCIIVLIITVICKATIMFGTFTVYNLEKTFKIESVIGNGYNEYKDSYITLKNCKQENIQCIIFNDDNIMFSKCLNNLYIKYNKNNNSAAIYNKDDMIQFKIENNTLYIFNNSIFNK